MKKHISLKSQKELLRKYPIENLLDGWFFRIEEVSNGYFIGEGSDYYGRLVSLNGNDPEKMLNQLVEYAKRISK